MIENEAKQLSIGLVFIQRRIQSVSKSGQAQVRERVMLCKQAKLTQ